MVQTRATNPNKKRMEVIKALTQAIHDSQEGWVVSPGGMHPLRIEVLPGTGLADRLAESGYVLQKLGTNERLVNSVKSVIKNARGEPILTTTGAAPSIVDVYQLSISST